MDAHAGYPPRYCETLLREQTPPRRRFRCRQYDRQGRDMVPARGGRRSELASRQWRVRSPARLAKAASWTTAITRSCGLPPSNRCGGTTKRSLTTRTPSLTSACALPASASGSSGLPPVTYFPRATPLRPVPPVFQLRPWPSPHPAQTQVAGPSSGQSLPAGRGAERSLLALLSPLSPALAAPAAVWASLCVSPTARRLALACKIGCAMTSGVAAMATQAGWSFGFLAGVAQCLRDRTRRQGLPAAGILKEAGDERLAWPPRPAARPLVSVIMANRDGGRFIAAAIDSVRRQSLSDLELIVSDDGSRDDSVTIVEAAMAEDPRIRLIRWRGERRSGGRAQSRPCASRAHGSP